MKALSPGLSLNVVLCWEHVVQPTHLDVMQAIVHHNGLRPLLVDDVDDALPASVRPLARRTEEREDISIEVGGEEGERE